MAGSEGKVHSEDNDSAIAKALELIDSLVIDREFKEIQELATEGRLQELFPTLFTDKPTPNLPKFDDLKQARSDDSSNQELPKPTEQ